MAENICLMKVTKDELPNKYFNEIAKDTETEVIIRSNLNNMDDIKDWVNSFGKLTNTGWIVQKSKATAERFICRKNFVCHHSNLRKSPTDKKTKNYNCYAAIFAKVKINNTNTRHWDNYIKLGLCGIIKIRKTHSHPLSTESALSVLQTDEQIKERFHRYFAYGMGVRESIRYHLRHLELQDYSDLDFANGRLNPPARRIQYWHVNWRKKNSDTEGGGGHIELVEQQLKTYAKKGIKILLHENPFAMAIVTPLMKRSHELKSSQEVVFVDSVSACDNESHCVTFMFTPCAAGASPLAVIITNDQSYKSFVAGFKLISIAIPNDFGGQGFPDIFITDNITAEIEALKTIWPQSKNLLYNFCLYQDFWTELWKVKDITKENKLCFVRTFQKMLDSKSSEEATAAFQNLHQNLVDYPEFQNYLSNYWDQKELCCQAWQDMIFKDNCIRDFLMVSVKVFIEAELSRIKPYNILALIDFCCEELENYHCCKFLQFLNSKSSSARLFLESFYKKVCCLEPGDVLCFNADEYNVYSEDKTELYVINIKAALCSCPQGQYGKFCKHQCALYKYFDIPENIAPITAEDRYEIAQLMLGDDLPMKSYHQPLEIKIDKKHFISE